MKNCLSILICYILCVSLYGQNTDAQVLHYFNQQESMHRFSNVISNTTIYVAAAIPVAMGITSLASKDDELLKATFATIAGMGINTALTYGLKYSINRKRPYERYPNYINNIHEESSPAMPSGHTSIAFASATSLCLHYPKWYIIAPSAIWTCSVAYSRMNLGVHYPTDVLAGAALGAASAYLTYKVNKFIWKKTGNKKLIGLEAYEKPLHFAYKL